MILTAPPPGLGAGEYITRVRWEYARAAPGMRHLRNRRLAGRVTNPTSRLPSRRRDTIQNCAGLTST